MSGIKALSELAIRREIRKLLESTRMPVDMNQGQNYFNGLKQAAVSGVDTKELNRLIASAINAFKNGDRADQKFADNLRAYKASVRSGHPKWVIAELAFAEWQNRRKANPVDLGFTPGSVQDPFARTGFKENRRPVKLTRLEEIYEAIVDHAQQNGREPFDVLDDMMAVAEKETSPEQSSSQLDGSPMDCCDGEFTHKDVRINNPLYDPMGVTEVDPVETYGDSFMNSKFPFVHGEFFITDPRYNETGTLPVEPVSYYGDAFKNSAYFNLFKPKTATFVEGVSWNGKKKIV